MVSIREINIELREMDGLPRLSYIIEGIIPGTKLLANVYRMDHLKKYYNGKEDLKELNPKFHDLLEHYLENDEQFCEGMYAAFVKYHEVPEKDEKELYSIGLAYNVIHKDIHSIIGQREAELRKDLNSKEWSVTWHNSRVYIEKYYHAKQYDDFYFKFLKRKKSL